MTRHRPLQVGITGGIGSGKSLICTIFTHLGIPVYDADSRAKYLMTTDGILMSQIKKEFGPLSLNPDGTLNRTYLSDIVFNDPYRLSVLNNLVHPRVGEDYRKWVAYHKDVRYLLKEAALLYESQSYQSLDKIIVVYAPIPLRIERVLHRDSHRTRVQIESIIGKQMPDEEKVSRADYVIQNDESILVIPQVVTLHQELTLLSEEIEQ